MTRFSCVYSSPLGEILLEADEIGLTGLQLPGQYRSRRAAEGSSSPVLDTAKRWLDLYFSGKEPVFSVPLHLQGTPFQIKVWTFLQTIPYGRTVAYSDVARAVHCRSAQAAGGAVGRNPVSVIVPCHRVIGKNGSLTGYAGGIDKKIALFMLEGIDF